jgi:hypothetical protein
MGHAFDLQARLAEVKQQAQSQTGRLQIIGALHSTPGSSTRGHVCVVQCFDGQSRRHGLHMPMRSYRPFTGILPQAYWVLWMPSRSRAPAIHSARYYLRVLRASYSCICAKNLALRCCTQTIAEVLTGWRRGRCSMRFSPWNQAYRTRPSLHAAVLKPKRNDFASLALLEGGGNPSDVPG